jgi:hypothetical protein
MTQLSPKTYLPVNWADGMKINKDHFRSDQQAYNWLQALHSSALLNDCNYGLFLTGLANDTSRPIVLTTDNQGQVSIKLLSCHAITPGGHLIYIREGSTAREDSLMSAIPGLQIPYARLTALDTEYYIMLAVNPFNRIPAGEPDIAETQMRPPFTTPAYHIQLVDLRDRGHGGPGEFYLPLGRIKVSEGKVLLDEEYIPPCTCLAANGTLVGLHAELESFFGGMESNVLRIQQKIIQKNQQNELAMIIGELCDAMSVYLCGEYQRLLLEYKFQPPVRMVSGIAGLARLMKNRLDVYAGTMKDELLNYIAEWCGITQGEWEATATGICNFRYDHMNIRESVLQVEQFTRLTLRLFNSLAALEYIGKKREAGIFVKEHLVVPAAEMPAARRKSFLAD